MDWSPIWLSFKLAGITTLILLILCLPIAYWLSKGSSILKIIVETLLTMPLFLPPSVLGFYLLIAFSPNHGLGKWIMQSFHIQLVFSFPGLVLASLIYNLPFMIGPIKSGLKLIHNSLAQASFMLGKNEISTFFKVLLPNARSSVFTGMVQTFAHTLGEFGVVLMIGGNIPGLTRLTSMAIYDSVEKMDYASANTYSLILFGITILLIFLVFIFNKQISKNSWE